VVPVEALYERYIGYLRNDKGLAENSIIVYRHYIHDFLTDMDHAAGALAPTQWTAMTIQHYVLEHIGGRSAEYSRLLAVALRSFLRFLYFRGEMVADMARSIPMTRKYSQATVPSFLSSDEVERIVATANRPSLSGTRDRTVLLLLARLGLRAGEITTLELDDIRWRTAEIVIRGKGRTMNTLPLLSDVGEALTLYLRTDRPLSTSRRVFLRTVAPNIGFAGPAAIGHIVRAALVRAGIHRTTRGAAHIFRHTLATRMIRSGASLTQIGEVLRHRSQSSTMIYAKVSFESLRGVARPWPDRGSPS
jgi:site-specific recombinase XerD